LFFGFYIVLRSEPLLVKNIIVTTDYDINANPELVKILEKARWQNIFQLNERTLAEKIKDTDLKINQVMVQKKIPGKILVDITSRQALAVIPGVGKFFLIDKDGLVFEEKKEAAGLPILNLDLQNIKLGSRIDDRYKGIFLILEKLGKEVSTVSQTEEEIKLELTDGSLIVLPVDEQLESKLYALQTLLNRFKIEGKRPRKIDLRFEKPIVTF